MVAAVAEQEEEAGGSKSRREQQRIARLLREVKAQEAGRRQAAEEGKRGVRG